jgi:hypothetical protein
MIQKNQCLAIDKLVKTKGKVAEAPEAEVDPAVKEVVLDQMDQWTEMIERHRLKKSHAVCSLSLALLTDKKNLMLWALYL